MMIVDRDAQELRFGETRRFRLAERGVHVPQNDAQGFRSAGRDNPTARSGPTGHSAPFPSRARPFRNVRKPRSTQARSCRISAGAAAAPKRASESPAPGPSSPPKKLPAPHRNAAAPKPYEHRWRRPHRQDPPIQRRPHSRNLPSGSDASWHATSRLLAGRLDQHRIPAPQIIVGQMRAAPPAVDWIVPAEVFLVGKNSLAEFGDR